MAKTVDSMACPLLLDLTPGQLSGPLAELQARETHHDEMRKLVGDINVKVEAMGEKGTDEETLTTRFEMFWEEFHGALEAIRNETVAGPEPVARPLEDQIEEILRIVRRLPRDERSATQRLFSRLGRSPSQVSLWDRLASVGSVGLDEHYEVLIARLSSYRAELLVLGKTDGDDRLTHEYQSYLSRIDNSLRLLRREWRGFLTDFGAETVGHDRIDTFIQNLDGAQIQVRQLKKELSEPYGASGGEGDASGSDLGFRSRPQGAPAGEKKEGL